MKFSFRLLFIGKQSWGDSIYDLFSTIRLSLAQCSWSIFTNVSRKVVRCLWGNIISYLEKYVSWEVTSTFFSFLRASCEPTSIFPNASSSRLQRSLLSTRASHNPPTTIVRSVKADEAFNTFKLLQSHESQRTPLKADEYII